MAEIIAIANQKGGVGKTTTAHATGQGLIFNGYKVLFIDLDNQANLSYTMRASLDSLTAYEVLNGKATAAEAIQHTEAGDIIAASPQLAISDRTLQAEGADLILKKALEPIASQYEFIIIDCPPALGILTINAFSAASRVIIPAQADIYSLQGIGQLYSTITAVQQYTNPELKIAGILITRYSGRAILSRDLSELLTDTAEQLKTKVYKTQIREAIAVKEAQAQKQSIFSYVAKSNPAKDYNSFINELLEDMKNTPRATQKRKKGFR